MDDNNNWQLVFSELAAIRQAQTNAQTDIRELRTDVSDWRTGSEGRLSIVETHVKTGITGNGQPSRLAVVEEKADKSEKRWVYTLGAGFGGGAVVSAILWVVEFLVKR